jgi:CRISPR/Cas system CSM-associated protein Csm3 (group 7 of RAMP superfamily)
MDRLGEHSYIGRLTCDLATITRLFTADHQQATAWSEGDRGQKLFPFLRNSNGDPILQGASLKGMIRSIYEAAFPSCLPLVAVSGTSKKVGTDVEYHWTLPADYEHERCDGLKNLCPSCSLFGIAQGDEVHAQGRVIFSDAALTQGALQEEEVKLSELSSPKPHSKIYSRNGEIRGRKLFYHHDPDQQPQVDQLGPRSNVISEFAPPGTVFTFSVRFENLSKLELSRLLAILTLDSEHAHKLGMAKPLGYGSCRITIRQEGSFAAEGGSRYQSWGSGEPSFDLPQGKIEEEWLKGDLEKLLRRKREGVGLTGYPPLKGYGNGLDIDEEGRYVTTTKLSPKVSPVPSIPESTDPAEVIASILKLSRASEKVAPPPQPRKKVSLKIVSYEDGRFFLRNPETGQEDIVFKNSGVPWRVGQTVTVRVVKVASDGRILEIKP